MVTRFRVPDGYDTVAFVPCAKTKPWAGATSGIYKSYNRLRHEFPRVYFVTISEPLGVVPQDLWDDFPQYDNPGLFRDPVQRSGGMFTSDWRELFGVSSRLETPFDPGDYDVAIGRLAGVIHGFVENNRRPGMRFLSFVEDHDFDPNRKSVGTHSDMLNRANVIDAGARFRKRGAPREEPYEYLRGILAAR
jgi:hypothetical protein